MTKNKVLEQSKFKIYVDLDGVLADFDKRVKQLSGKCPHELTKFEIWATILKHDYLKGTQFFNSLDKMTDANDLWEYIKPYTPEVLTATGAKIRSAGTEKKLWFKRNFCPNTTVNVVLRSINKKQYAAPNHILIDDREKCINPWIEAGGIGILHTDTKSTINELKELGL